MGSGSSILTPKQSVDIAKALLLECEGLKGSDDYKAGVLVRKYNELLVQNASGNRNRIENTRDRASVNQRTQRPSISFPTPAIKDSKSVDAFIPMEKIPISSKKPLGSASSETLLSPLASYSLSHACSLDNDDHTLFCASIEMSPSSQVNIIDVPYIIYVL